MQNRRFRLSRSGARRGITFIEVLVATLILSVGLTSLIGVWTFAFNITRRTDETGIAYSLARQAVERQRTLGYLYAGSTTEWYNQNGTSLPDNAGAYYRVDVAVYTDTTYGGQLSYLNQKEIAVTVTRLSDSTPLHSTQSYLTMGGI
jgi:Tfp pilus assembly protein PilV